jgi:hypothetical protein
MLPKRTKQLHQIKINTLFFYHFLIAFFEKNHGDSERITMMI